MKYSFSHWFKNYEIQFHNMTSTDIIFIHVEFDGQATIIKNSSNFRNKIAKIINDYTELNGGSNFLIWYKHSVQSDKSCEMLIKKHLHVKDYFIDRVFHATSNARFYYEIK